jgi:hypothetical protein
LRHHPVGRKAGRTRLFTEDHFAALVESLPRYKGAPELRLNPTRRGAKKPHKATATGESWTERTRRTIREKHGLP